MSTSEERKIGFRRGIRAAVTWLHAFGKGMNDPHAKVVLDLAADRLGRSKLQDISAEPAPTRAALEDRLAECEAALNRFDEGHDSEYWLRHATARNALHQQGE